MNGCVSPFGRRNGQGLPAEVQDPSQVCRTCGTRILKSSQSKESGQCGPCRRAECDSSPYFRSERT
jgi:hypothetical protein